MNIGKKIWLHTFKTYLGLGLFFYFKKIKVYNAKVLPKDKSVLILCNHQNALLDPLLIATKSIRFIHFLARASVFKKSFVDTFLRSLQMLPVYRVRDGWNNLSKNHEIFENCSYLLGNNEGILIFPEGSHNLVRTVRPLSKGFTRIVFETLQKYPDSDLKLLPVGLNYVQATKSRDSVSMYFGELIDAKKYLADFKNDEILELKRDVHAAISKLTTHIPQENYKETLEKLENLNVDFLKPDKVNACIQSGFKDCESKPKREDNWLQLFLMFLLRLIVFPAYLVWKLYVQPKITELEFTSTFRFAIALTLVPLWLCIVGIILSILFSWIIGVGFVLSTLVLALIAIKLL